MPHLEALTPDTVSDKGAAALTRAQEAFGFVPNLIKVLANAPAAAHAYLDLAARLDESSLSPQEREVVLLATSFEHECRYCMAAHSTVAGMVGIGEEDLRALREGDALPTARLDVLRDFTRALVEKRGNPSAEDLRRFQDAGYTRPQVLEVLTGVAMKTMSNYTNHIAETPLDEAFEPQSWAPPVQAASL